MKYRFLGNTGVQVSELGFGTMTFGSEADEAMSRKLFYRCRDAGINLFDCANIYGNDRDGDSEKILGKLIQDCRDELIITTKVGTPRWGTHNDGGLSRRYIMIEVEKSLKRLNTDRIDIYFIHKLDKNTPMEETLRAFDDLQRQGKILYPAISNAAAWQIALALGISERESLARFSCIEPMYNLVKRQAEVEILPLAQDQNLGVISYSPLAAGLLTGKYSGKNRDAEGRINKSERYKGRYSDKSNFETAEAFTSYAKKKGLSPVALAIAWVKSHPAVTAPLIGARNMEQLESSLEAVDIDMDEDWRKEISALSVEPASATDRTEEKLNPSIIGH
ncbi:MAG: aldo/keto reductase [Sphaerochaetaceae bacterium]